MTRFVELESMKKKLSEIQNIPNSIESMARRLDQSENRVSETEGNLDVADHVLSDSLIKGYHAN